MKTLLKYEFIKMRMGILAMVFATLLVQAVFMFGTYADDERFVAFGIVALCLVAYTGLILAATYSISQLYRELNTKQAYMLFMTPNNSYSIVGSKVIAGFVLFLLTGIGYAVLADIDIRMVSGAYGVLDGSLFRYLVISFGIDRLPMSWFVVRFSLIALFFVCLMTTGFLAVVIETIIIGGKKGAWWLAFILMLLLAYAEIKWVGTAEYFFNGNMIDLVQCGMWLVLTVLTAFYGSYLMDRKLSV